MVGILRENTISQNQFSPATSSFETVHYIKHVLIRKGKKERDISNYS